MVVRRLVLMFALSWLGLFLAQCPGSGEDPTGAATVFSFGGLFVHHYYSHLMELVPTAVRLKCARPLRRPSAMSSRKQCAVFNIF